MFKKLPAKARVMKEVLGGNFGLTFNRMQLLTLQFSKLVNYFQDDLSFEWGGDFANEESSSRIGEALERFLIETDGIREGPDRWMHRKFPDLPWGPDNFKLKDQPALELGAPYEPYLATNGGILTCNQAARILCILPADLVNYKLRLILDRNVIAAAIKKMLLPRAEWVAVKAERGVNSQSFRPPQ